MRVEYILSLAFLLFAADAWIDGRRYRRIEKRLDRLESEVNHEN
jgi:hypothetical protein